MPLEPTKTGLLARAPEYLPLRAFSQTGRYWDRVPQQLIREGAFAEFLPPVEPEEDDRGKFGRFHSAGGKELLSRSKPVGPRGIPPAQLERLRQAIAEFKLKANTEGAQPQNLELIERFRLPDIAHDPELYRLAGPWWNRRLQILWGCERTSDSSIPAAAAAGKLRGDKHYNLRRLLTALALLLLLALAAWWIASWRPSAPHRPPAAAEAERKTEQAARAEAAVARAEAEARHAQNAAAKAQAAFQAARKAAAKAKAETCRIVLCGQEPPDADGTLKVSLEVHSLTDPNRHVSVEAWHFENHTVTAKDRLDARMKPGVHTVKALIRDPAGGPVEVSAAVTVEPGKIVATPGKVSVKPN